SLGELRVGPAVDPLNPDRYLVATSNAGLPSGGGILAVDLLTQTSKWIAAPTGTGLSSIRGPAFSPDGSSIAFGAVRSETTTKPKKTTYYKGVYTVPFSVDLIGDPIITTVTESANSNSGDYVTVNNWFIP